MSFQASCSEVSSPVPSSGTLQWPDLELQGESFKTEFTDKGEWKCPLCDSEVKQIKNHLKKHQDHIEDWEIINRKLLQRNSCGEEKGNSKEI